MSKTKALSRTQVIKQALANLHGFKNVSVKRGTGTARSWIHVEVRTNEVKHWEDGREMTREESEARHKFSHDIENVIEAALKINGMELSHFTSDDGYDSEYSCLQIGLSPLYV